MPEQYIPAAYRGGILPPSDDVCQRCAVDHDPELPHDQTSLYWQYWFHGEAGRWPTWDDAMDHCTEETKSLWKRALAEVPVMGPEEVP